MKILQFVCPSTEMANQLIGMMTNQANVWSRLHWLTTDPDYVTNKFSTNDWHTHLVNNQLYWTNWDNVYNNLGDDGKLIADQFLKPGAMTGLLLDKALIAELPTTMLDIEEINDLVLSGYTSN